MAEEKKVKVIAIASGYVENTSLWGVDFTFEENKANPKKGILTATMPKDEADAMVEAERVTLA